MNAGYVMIILLGIASIIILSYMAYDFFKGRVSKKKYYFHVSYNVVTEHRRIIVGDTYFRLCGSNCIDKMKQHIIDNIKIEDYDRVESVSFTSITPLTKKQIKVIYGDTFK